MYPQADHENPETANQVIRGRREIAFVGVASRTRIDQIVVRVISSRRKRMEVINGELSTCVNLRDTAVAAPEAEPLPDCRMLGMRHPGLVACFEEMASVLAESALQRGDLTIELRLSLLQSVALGLGCMYCGAYSPQISNPAVEPLNVLLLAQPGLIGDSLFRR
jgi:hypothetical protein